MCRRRRKLLSFLASFIIRLLDGAVVRVGQGQIEPLPDRFEKPEPVHRFTGQIFLGITRLTLTGPQPYTYANILVIY
jgi:hypothetical protein